MAQGVRGNNPAGLKLLVNLILAFLPAAVVPSGGHNDLYVSVWSRLYRI